LSVYHSYANSKHYSVSYADLKQWICAKRNANKNTYKHSYKNPNKNPYAYADTNGILLLYP
jgi:GH18 family chitinase